jgi:hypothetical protein
MAKSTRSKVKRAFRAKKRKEGVFAAAEAARLQRLNAKLHALATATTGRKEDPGVEKEVDEDGQQTVDMLGSCWFAALGLVDHEDISPALLHNLGFSSSAFSLPPISHLPSYSHSLHPDGLISNQLPY